MELFFVIVVLLFFLAITDLIVGVSNDAVNFLNSAIGSKVASRNTIMIVASIGIVIGATFASGMMEVARKGIFNPQFFSFSEVMFIFLAVMLTDIILLDLFNTFGLPTSTTVSIVFELLGASVAMAIIKITGNGEGLSALSTYINSSSALTIILGIFLSVGVAFTIGALIQYLTRLLFTFNYEKRIRWVGVVWSGIALAAIAYFLLIKGLKGASFIPAGFKAWTAENTLLLLIISAAITTLLSFVLHILKINILRMVVLAGTFSLAMAFAGNDLVNFIGVPLAGFESYNAWSGSGSDPDSFMMTILASKYPAKTYMLLIAGAIMVITLWLSRKAQSVTETEVNLGRQSEGLERFRSNKLSRGIVRLGNRLARRTGKALSGQWQKKIEASFEPLAYRPRKGEKHYDPPAFDLVRASVNLTVASILIAIATSYKLPLSTTYVSFMVAMGTSLSDRAWGRDSAVYRVAGVLNVIGGWFMTAFSAFTVAGLFAWLLFKFEGWAVGGLLIVALAFIINTFFYHRRAEKKKQRIRDAQRQAGDMPAEEVILSTADNISEELNVIRDGYLLTIEGLRDEDLKKLNQAKEVMQRLQTNNEEFKYTFYGSIRRIKEKSAEGSRTFLLAYDLEQDIVQSATFIVDSAHQHVNDVLLPLTDEQNQAMGKVYQMVNDYLDRSSTMIRSRNFDDFEQLIADKAPVFDQIEALLARQAEGIKGETYSARNSILFFSLLLETKDLIAVAARFVKLYYRLHHKLSEDNPWVLVSG